MKQSAKPPRLAPTSLHPLTPNQALRAALRIDPAELKALEDREKAERAKRKKAKARRKKK